MPLRAQPDVIRSDVLVIGGGFAGCYAALTAAACGSRVVLIDKAFVSRSGASTMSGGITTCPTDEDDLDEWADEFITRGHYMCNRAWTLKVLEGQVQRVRDFIEWDVPIVRNEDGSIRRVSSRGMITVRGMQYNPKKAMEALRRRLLDRGVTIIDRHLVTELLTADGCHPTSAGICGAFAIHTRTGAPLAVVAKRTVIATGIIAMKGTHTVDNDTGDGPAIAYRAGARLVDYEFSFGGTFSKLLGRYSFGNYNVAVAHGARLINSAGERFMERYDPVRLERSELARVVAAFTKEIIDGKGPVFVDLRHCKPGYWESLEAVQGVHGGGILLSGKVPDPRTTPLPIEPTWGMWNGSRSGLKIDLGCRTTLPGLLAAGAAAKNEATGTHASAGVPTAYAMNTGVVAGETASREAAEEIEHVVTADQLAQALQRALDPLRRHGPAVHARGLHAELCALERPITDLMSLNAAKLKWRIERSLELLEAAATGSVETVHDLVKLHEARNVALNAYLLYSAALDRTESREQFHREDYPETDNENWFCWHGFVRGQKGPIFDRESIPLDTGRYDFRPTSTRKMSSIAAIMRGVYNPGDYD